MSDAFTKPQPEPRPEPDAFDINAWISGVKLPEKSVVVYGRSDLVGEYEALGVELAKAQATAAEIQDDRLSGPAKDDPADIAERMEQTRQLMAGSARTFRFRSPSPDEITDVKTEAGKKATNLEVTFRLLARQCVAPAGLTWENFKAMYAGLGDGYFSATVLRCANEAREAADIDIPFSRKALAARRTQDS